jgi:hypothetical protein
MNTNGAVRIVRIALIASLATTLVAGVLWSQSRNDHQSSGLSIFFSARELVRHQVDTRDITLFCTTSSAAGAIKGDEMRSLKITLLFLPELATEDWEGEGRFYPTHHNLAVFKWAVFAGKTDREMGLRVLQALGKASPTFHIVREKKSYPLSDIIQWVSTGNYEHPILTEAVGQWESRG